uniref:NADH-ubiquinone oxidoreductase chain 2 n=1 Tax=Megalotomus costalis TaxID=763254 RepID=A0A8K1RSA7_9HEMI|nr:NADH dehydrogenase subunit 2 [Megalotomus costalis]
MVFNYSKMMFMMMTIMSSLMVLSADNWLGMWMGLEINLMSFIPLISKSKNKSTSQAMMIYFLTQSIGSITLLFSVLMNSMILLNLPFNKLIMILMYISIMIKIGMAPFHLWLPEMLSNLPWFEALILLTWQKVGPLFVLNNMNPNMWLIYFSAISSAMIGAIGGLNQTSLRKILAYSSINHLGWMTLFMSMNISWYKYLMIYSLLIFLLCTILSGNNFYFINQINSSSVSMMEKYLFSIMLLSIGGLPPFIGFLPKWMVIQSMIKTNLYFILILMMFFSLITLFYYLRLISSMILLYSSTNKWNKYSKMNNFFIYMIYLINLSLPVFSIINF